VKRCDELERKLRFFSGEIAKFELECDSPGSIDSFLEDPTVVSSTGENGSGKILETLEVELEKYESQLRELNVFSEKLTVEYNEKVELQEVLEKARRFFITDVRRLGASHHNSGGGRTPANLSSLLDSERRPNLDMRFSFMSGVISTEESARFERMVFRTTRGNCYVRFEAISQPIVDPESGLLLEKSVFVIFYKSEAIEAKLKRICDAFQAHRYSLPNMDDGGSVDRMITENAQELVDSRTVLLKNQDTRYRLCLKMSHHINRWTWIVLREKAIYHSLNMFKADVSGMLRGEGWAVAENLHEVREAVERAHSNMDSGMPSHLDRVPQPWPTPPTHFVTNKFTYAYQEFVNTYGIPRYREANPALFTAATFPFLFGVMYGDIGHGMFLFLNGLSLVWNEKTMENAKMDEMTEGLHVARCVVRLHGCITRP
jgi:V-type H+-transporting ATPase subunit a